MFITHKKGELAQLKVEQRALEKDIIVCRPTTEARFDLILVDGKDTKRVQVKYADEKDAFEGNSIRVSLKRECRNNGYRKQYNKDEIDAVVAYLPEIDKTVWLEPELFEGKWSIMIRLKPAKNGQKKGVTFLEDVIW